MTKPSSGAIRVIGVFATAEDRASLREFFNNFRWTSQFVDSCSTLDQVLWPFEPDVVLTDSELARGESWKDILRSAQERPTRIPVVVSSRLADERLWAEVLNLGAYDLLVKPFIAAEVQSVVGAAAATTRPLLRRAG